jgi:hypothetical protein
MLFDSGVRFRDSGRSIPVWQIERPEVRQDRGRDDTEISGDSTQGMALGPQLDNLAYPGLTTALAPSHDSLLGPGDAGANTSR